MNTKSAIVIGLSFIIASLILSFAILSNNNIESGNDPGTPIENGRCEVYGNPPTYFIVLDTQTGASWILHSQDKDDWNGKPIELIQ